MGLKGGDGGGEIIPCQGFARLLHRRRQGGGGLALAADGDESAEIGKRGPQKIPPGRRGHRLTAGEALEPLGEFCQRGHTRCPGRLQPRPHGFKGGIAGRQPREQRKWPLHRSAFGRRQRQLACHQRQQHRLGAGAELTLEAFGQPIQPAGKAAQFLTGAGEVALQHGKAFAQLGAGSFGPGQSPSHLPHGLLQARQGDGQFLPAAGKGLEFAAKILKCGQALLEARKTRRQFLPQAGKPPFQLRHPLRKRRQCRHLLREGAKLPVKGTQAGILRAQPGLQLREPACEPVEAVTDLRQCVGELVFARLQRL